MANKAAGKATGRVANTRAGKREAVDAGSGNVFADLGFADADERRLRVQLAMQLNELIAARQLTQAQAAALFGIPQPHVSELRHYKLTRFSSERLLRFLTRLDRDVEIVIRPKALGHASGMVSVLVSREETHALIRDRAPSLNDTNAQYDVLLSRMQTPAARKVMAVAFDAAPVELGRVAAKAARRRR